MKKILKTAKGFTLIELLVVIAIIGILAVFTLAFLAPARQKGRDAKRKEDLNAVAKALELYYSDNNAYYAAGATVDCALPTDSAGASADSYNGLDDAAGLVTTYIPSLPIDPTGTAAAPKYRYCVTAAADGYVLDVLMENLNDPQRANGGVTTAATNWFRLCGGTYVGAANADDACSK